MKRELSECVCLCKYSPTGLQNLRLPNTRGYFVYAVTGWREGKKSAPICVTVMNLGGWEWTLTKTQFQLKHWAAGGPWDETSCFQQRNSFCVRQNVAFRCRLIHEACCSLYLSTLPQTQSYLLLQLNHLLLLQKEVTQTVFVWIRHQSVSVVGAQLETNRHAHISTVMMMRMKDKKVLTLFTGWTMGS